MKKKYNSLKKEKIDLNEVFDSYKSGEISIQKGIELICKSIFLVPEYFGLSSIDCSNIGEFIIFLYPYLTKVFLLFSTTKSTFVTYLQTIVRLQYKSFLRKKFKEEAKFNSIKVLYNEIDTGKRYRKISEITPYYIDKEEKEDSLLNIKFSENNKINRKCLLVFALKLSYYLTEKDIYHLSLLINIDADKLWHYKEAAVSSLKNKIKVREKKDNLLTSTYLSRIIYRMELEQLKEKNYYYFKAKNTYNLLDNRWKKMLESRKEKPIFVSNSELSRILNISLSKIRTLVCYIKKYDENIFG